MCAIIRGMFRFCFMKVFLCSPLTWMNTKTYLKHLKKNLRIAVTIFRYSSYSTSDNVTPPISGVLIGQYLIFADWRHQRAVTRLENVRQSNITRDKKLGVQLSHRHPLFICNELQIYNESWFVMNSYWSQKQLKNVKGFWS